MNDIRPPKRLEPTQPQRPRRLMQEPSVDIDRLQPASHIVPPAIDIPQSNQGLAPVSQPPKKRRWVRVLLALILIIIAATVSVIAWYRLQLAAVDSNSTETSVVQVAPGSSPQVIGSQLANEGLIRNETAFAVHLRLSGLMNKLQAGRHNLSPSMTTPEIVQELASAEAEEITVTFLPGATIRQHKQVLENAGYNRADIDAAFDKQYDHPVLADKPASASLEGYIYGETYQFATSATVEDVITRTLDELQSVITANNLLQRYEQKQMSLYQGLTLASIIQREERTFEKQQRVSQVFNLRLEIGMPLGSDPTYQYAADERGVPRDPAIDSPYNTRRVIGLPPGPIASPGETALRAVVEPAAGDFLYFLSGDDDRLYFGRTLEEHEANIRNHCAQKCQIL